jgi:UDP-N-acetyl-D-mannosaminuronic acid dehydrogenase
MQFRQLRRVSVVGLGYIGLPTAAVVASKGVEVIGVDISPRVVDTLARGEVHIREPDLDALVHDVVKRGLLKVTTKPEKAEAFVIAVPTPFAEDKRPDVSFVEAACRSIAPVLEPGNVVILESTSPVGTTERMAEWLSDARPDLRFPSGPSDSCDVHLAYCPERVLPGRILRELVDNTRLIGGITAECAEIAKSFYRIFVTADCILTDTRTAELSKLTENAFRDVNIAFANELSLICDRLGIDVWKLIELANHHPRVKILRPGPGVGGHCIAVDPWFIVDAAPEQAHLIRAARLVNDGKPAWVLKRILDAVGAMKRPRIACLGLAYKANVDDLRESPSLHIVEELARADVGDVLVVEPHLSELPKSLKQFSNVRLVGLNAALDEADLIVGLVDHDAFKMIDRSVLATKKTMDECGVWR